MIVTLIIFLEIIFSSLGFFLQGYKAFKTWKTLRDELLLHLTIYFSALAILIIVFTVYIAPQFFNIHIDTNVAVISMGLFYDLFYLELSIIYLTIFTNSRTIFESYAPFIIGVSTVVNIYTGITTSFRDRFYLIIIFHGIIIVIGICLLLLGVRHLKRSREYIMTNDEKEFNEYLIKLFSILPIVLIFDALGFLLYEAFPSYVQNLNELLFLMVGTILLTVTILVLYFSKSISERVNKINLANYLNTIS